MANNLEIPQGIHDWAMRRIQDINHDQRLIREQRIGREQRFIHEHVCSLEPAKPTRVLDNSAATSDTEPTS